MLERIRNFPAQDSRVRQFHSHDPFARAAGATEKALNPEKISLRMFPREFAQECTVAATEIDFDRRPPTEQQREIEQPRSICRQNFNGDSCW